MSYDNEGHLVAWQNGPTAPTATATDLYDGSGSRVEQQTTTDGVTTTTAYVDGVAEVASTGTTTTTTTYYYADGRRIALAVNGTFSYLATDPLGSPTVAVDPTGQPTASVLYTPFGTVRSSSGSMPTSYGFTGQRTDATTGLDDYGARFYDPGAGQFAGADTTSDGINGYAYVHQSPETLTDPTGHAAGQGPGGRPPKKSKIFDLLDKAVKAVQGAIVVASFIRILSGAPTDLPPEHSQVPGAVQTTNPAGDNNPLGEGTLGGDDAAGERNPVSGGPGSDGPASGGGAKKPPKKKQWWEGPGSGNPRNRFQIPDATGLASTMVTVAATVASAAGQGMSHPFAQPTPPPSAYQPPATTIAVDAPTVASPSNPVQAVNTANLDPAASTPAWQAPSVAQSWTPPATPVTASPVASSWSMNWPSLTAPFTNAWNWYTGLPWYDQVGIGIGVALIGLALLPEELLFGAVAAVGGVLTAIGDAAWGFFGLGFA
jgi:RHS repeat-associated protein